LIPRFLPVQNYALAETLGSGQAFRWREVDGGWEGVIQSHWVRLVQERAGLRAISNAPTITLEEYLQTSVDIEQVIATFPKDEHMIAAVQACRGLRLLRQDPWECLASFILSSTKQIVQIQQIVELLCERFGDRVKTPTGARPAFAFPGPERIATLNESELRSCKMGFRAPYLKGSAEMVLRGEIDLARLKSARVEIARTELMRLPGVGRKIADCVLLFAYGFQQAFPIDVWILKALKQLYFARRRPTPRRLFEFTQTYFGPNAGYAQQYLFHYMRTHHEPEL
jgi:N-glycosylase/DNA lyase